MSGITEHHYTTLSEAVDDLNNRGFTDEFKFDGKRLLALQREKVFNADELVILEHHRFEGTSAPQDMSVVYALEAKDGTKGTYVDAYGTYSDTGIVTFLNQVPIRD